MEYILPSIIVFLLCAILLTLRTVCSNLYVENNNLIKAHKDMVRLLTHIANKD
jgi:hypothetical protein